MRLLVILVLAFAVAHILPSHPRAKAFFRDRMGKAFLPSHGLLLFLLFAAMVWAYRQAPAGFSYDLPAWGRHANFLLSLLGFTCFGIFLFRGSWRQWLVYPMAIGVILWAAGHLLANGEARSLLFFGGLAVAAMLHAAALAATGQWPTPEVRQGHNFLSVLAGLSLYGIMTQLHHAVTGVPLVELQ